MCQFDPYTWALLFPLPKAFLPFNHSTSSTFVSLIRIMTYQTIF